MEKDLSYYMNLKYKIEIIEDTEEGGYALRHPELNGCITCAETIEEGLKNLEDAKKAWIQACIEDGVEIPEPDDNNFSGQLRLRMPKSLHRELSMNADKEGISMNQYIIYLLSKSVGRVQS